MQIKKKHLIITLILVLFLVGCKKDDKPTLKELDQLNNLDLGVRPKTESKEIKQEAKKDYYTYGVLEYKITIPFNKLDNTLRDYGYRDNIHAVSTFFDYIEQGENSKSFDNKEEAESFFKDKQTEIEEKEIDSEKYLVIHKWWFYEDFIKDEGAKVEQLRNISSPLSKESKDLLASLNIKEVKE